MKPATSVGGLKPVRMAGFDLKRCPSPPTEFPSRGPASSRSKTEIVLGPSKTLEFKLPPRTPRRDDIEVVAGVESIRTDRVAASRQISEQKIQSLPYTGRRDFLNALALMPGMLRDQAGRLHVHGALPEQTGYQLDGMNLADPSTGILEAAIPIDAIGTVDADMDGVVGRIREGVSRHDLRAQSEAGESVPVEPDRFHSKGSTFDTGPLVSYHHGFC